MRGAPHPYSLRQLQYAVAVADTLSFRKAAQKCRVAQPSLSAQLGRLEEALGMTLFERDKRRVLMTEMGKEVVRQARATLRSADDLWDAAQRVKEPLSGPFRIGVIPTIAPYLLPYLMPRLRENFPQLIPLFREDKTAHLCEELENGGLDAALVALEAPLGEVEVEPIARDPFVVAVHRDHPLSRSKRNISPAQLEESEVLVLDEGHCFREQALAYCSRSRMSEVGFRATSLLTLVQMVAAGAGVTLLPELAVATEAARADLRVLRLAKPAPFRTIALIGRRASPLRGSLRRLAEVLRTAYPKGAALGFVARTRTPA